MGGLKGVQLRSMASWKSKGGVGEEGCKRREDFKADKVNFNFGVVQMKVSKGIFEGVLL